MKFVCTFLLSCQLFSLYGQLEALFDIKKFRQGKQHLVETYLYIFGPSLIQDKDTNVKNKKVEILLFIENEQKEIVDYKKHIIEGEIDHVNKNGILDLQRFSLIDGNYNLGLKLVDQTDTNNIEEHQQTFTLSKLNTSEFSDIELLDKYWKSDSVSKLNKSGFEMIPLVTTYFGPEFNRLSYYTEIYFDEEIIKENPSVILTQSILVEENNKIAGQYNKLNKISSSSVVPVLNSFDLSNLPTGNYVLKLSVMDKNQQILSTKELAFQRTNLNNSMKLNRLNSVSIANTFASDLHQDSLNEFMKCLAPLASNLEKNIIDNKLDDIDDTLKRQFIYSFWYNRFPNNPAYNWSKYKQEVKKTNQLFGTKVRKGYETDRGRIYLKYGPPNTITDRPNEPSAYPYQIWHYYKIGRFNNKRFVFYLPDLVSNDYVILHSTLQGEYFNNNWKTDLHSRNTPERNVDALQNPNDNQWGSNSNLFFINP
ncbi:MAG: GWxTD domain-containing protein [Bacteroidota bacterium]|nr:GWxTD domain-containing protein [Bacteroidota bacterium]